MVAGDQENILLFADAFDEIEGTDSMCVSRKANGAALWGLPLEQAAELPQPTVEDGVVVIENLPRALENVLPARECANRQVVAGCRWANHGVIVALDDLGLELLRSDAPSEPEPGKSVRL